MALRRGVDLSEHGGELKGSTVECWKAQGISFAVVQYSHLMGQQLKVLTSAGLDIEAYVYLYWGVDPWGQTPQVRTWNALNKIKDYPVKRLWLDCEDSTHNFNPSQLASCVGACHQAQIPTGIYTGRWWWEPRTGHSTDFASLPLWDAAYQEVEPEEMQSFVPYGGWNERAIHQWHNTTYLCGFSVDLNVMQGEENVTDEETKELGQRRAQSVLVHALLTSYRCEYTAADLATIRLLTLTGEPTGIEIPVSHTDEKL